MTSTGKQKQPAQVSVSAFGYLYCAIFDYCKGRSSNRAEIATRFVTHTVLSFHIIPLIRLEALGYDVGSRVLELLFFREKERKHETKISNLFQFVTTTVWVYLFGKQATLIKYADETRPCLCVFF